MVRSVFVVVVLALFLTAVSILLPFKFGASADAEAASRASIELLGKGRTELDKGNYADAIRLFEQAATANPKNAEAFTLLGRSYADVGLDERAYRFYSIALEINPDERQALAWSGRIDAGAGEEELAKAQEKLDRLERLCGSTCIEYMDLKSAIDNAGSKN